MTPAPRPSQPGPVTPAPRPPWRILITGTTSIHGWPIYQELLGHFGASQVFAVRPPDRPLPDGKNSLATCITDRDALMGIRERFNPTHVIHCAGVCDLDICETRPDWAEKLNAGGARVVSDIFGGRAYLMYLSSDLVFSGEAPPPGGYREEHAADPVSCAGRTIRAAEEMVAQCPRNCVVRLGLPLGDSITGTKGAIDWIAHRFKRDLPVTLFHDELRSCISCGEVGRTVLALLLREAEGLFHLGGEEAMTLFQIGEQVLEKGPYPARLLKGILREQEVDGPPRIGDVSLNSSKLRAYLAGNGRPRERNTP